MVKRILAPLASLKLTVVLLALSMLLIYAGTWAQVDTGSWQVQKQYFHNSFIWVNFQTLWPRPTGGASPIRGGFPMPGGYLLGALLLINLIAAHTVRFKMTWKRAGIIMIHGAMIALLVGEGITATMAVESHMTIEEGERKNYSEDIRTSELAVIDTSPKDHDQVTVIPAARVAQGGTIHDPQLPFDLRIDSFMPNSSILGPQQQQQEGVKAPEVTGGNHTRLAAVSVAPVNGLGGAIDTPSAYITPIVNGRQAGTYLLTTQALKRSFEPINGPQEVTVGDHTYQIQLRFKRLYKPYAIELKKFSFDRYTGTAMARNYSSDVRLVDSTRHEDREVRIWMNHPLRHGGETFYQADFNKETEHGTVLQVVSNPGWVLPYLACAVGALGLLVHFGMVLLTFISRQGRAANVPSAAPQGRSARKPARVKDVREEDHPWITRPAVLVPAIVVGLALMYVVYAMRPAPIATAYNLRDFASLPVSFEGRVQPFDSLARNSLKVISGRETLLVNGKRIPAVQWLLDVIARPDKAETYEVFRIDHPDVISLLALDPTKKLFSLEQIKPRSDKLMEQWSLANQIDSGNRDMFQKKIMELAGKIHQYQRVSRLNKQLTLLELLTADQMMRAQQLNGEKVDATRHSRIQMNAQMVADDLQKTAGDFKSEGNEAVLAVPPILGTDEWHPLDEAVMDDADGNHRFEPAARPLLALLEEYREDNADGFNTAVATYETKAQKLPETSIVAFETFFNRFDPFMLSMVFYIVAFVLVCASWLGSSVSIADAASGGGSTKWLAWSTPIYRSAVGLVLLSLAIHTFGLVARIIISGHPPVTNLASSAIFIAWGVVIFALGLEWFFRNTIGLVTATVVGCLSLLISHKLSLDGDTMKPLQAVLDTNFWLATHVICVTLGYSATFLAGFLGIVFVILGLFTPAMDKSGVKMLGKMIYGIACFAILFSFVGTVLGGIWADQSWGRFWGWDPKENGAVLIVLCNAILLHARWGGMARERGIALLAIFGNIVTSWSWFGTNMLGVGLHSYGFMDKALMWLLLFVGSQVLLILMGLIPLKYWIMTRNDIPAPQARGRGFEVAAAAAKS